MILQRKFLVVCVDRVCVRGLVRPVDTGNTELVYTHLFHRLSVRVRALTQISKGHLSETCLTGNFVLWTELLVAVELRIRADYDYRNNCWGNAQYKI